MYYYGGFFVGAFLVGLLLSYLGFGIVGIKDYELV